MRLGSGWRAALLAGLGGGLMAGPAPAIEISQKGSVAAVSGPIRNGDEFILRDFLARPEARQIRVVSLNSPGGRILPAREMARMIRKAGLTTMVDAARGACESACTGLFVAGVRRHYLNAGAIPDGEGRRGAGLGFHEGNSNRSAGGRGYSGAATAEMTNIYYEMGVSGAAALVTRSAFDRMYRVSGPTALSLGIATSLSTP